MAEYVKLNYSVHFRTYVEINYCIFIIYTTGIPGLEIREYGRREPSR
jgi:hypothetical protein